MVICIDGLIFFNLLNDLFQRFNGHLLVSILCNIGFAVHTVIG